MNTTDALTALPDLLDFDELCAVLRLGRTAARARTYDDDFPGPFVLSDGCYRWDRADVLTWLHGRRRKLTRRAKPASQPAAAATAPLPAPVPVAKRNAA